MNLKNETQAKYAAMVTNMDSAIGQVVDIFKKYNFWNDTVMVFSSDNGGDTSLGASNYPLRGRKGQFYEGGIKTIGFIHSTLLPDRKKASCYEIDCHSYLGDNKYYMYLNICKSSRRLS